MEKQVTNQKAAYRALGAILCLIVVWFPAKCHAFAEEKYYNDETGYQVIIEDDADLLSGQEEEALAEVMESITTYGNVAFKSIDYNEYSTERYIKNYYSEMFGSKSGTVFLIDMDNRNIWIYSNGGIYRVITDSYADTITDNIYRYASDREYFLCAKEAFSQILTLLQGNKIAQPMKYISNVLLSVILGLLITYFIVRAMSTAAKPSEKELLEATRYQYRLKNPQTIHTGTTKRYDPPSSSGGGGSGGGGGGGSSGGGGGGHSF